MIRTAALQSLFGMTLTTTIGNNVYAQNNPSGNATWETNFRPDGGRRALLSRAAMRQTRGCPPSVQAAAAPPRGRWSRARAVCSTLHGVACTAGHAAGMRRRRALNFASKPFRMDLAKQPDEYVNGYSTAAQRSAAQRSSPPAHCHRRSALAAAAMAQRPLLLRFPIPCADRSQAREPLVQLSLTVAAAAAGRLLSSST